VVLQEHEVAEPGPNLPEELLPSRPPEVKALSHYLLDAVVLVVAERTHLRFQLDDGDDGPLVAPLADGRVRVLSRSHRLTKATRGNAMPPSVGYLVITTVNPERLAPF
jgi:hypothetical protein